MMHTPSVVRPGRDGKPYRLPNPRWHRNVREKTTDYARTMEKEAPPQVCRPCLGRLAPPP